MLRAVLRDMRAHPGRLAMTLVAILLGVGFVVATWVVSDSAAESIAGGDTRTDVAVRVVPTDRSAKLDDEKLRVLAALPSAPRVSGVVLGYAALVQSNGKLGDTYYPPVGGTSWDSSGRFTLVTGRAPTAPEEVSLEAEAAAQAGLAAGSSARVLDQDGVSTMVNVVGIFAYHKASTDELAPAVAYPAATAQRRLGPGYAWAELFGPDAPALASAASGALGVGFDVRTGADLAADRASAANREANVVRNFLLAFAGVALMAGMFVIANTFTMLVAQRTRHFALLRAIGARRRQVRRAVLGESIVVGLVGSTAGIALGIGLGWLALTLLGPPGETLVFTVSPVAIGVGYLVGVVVTVVAAYGSARRAALVLPVAALGADSTIPRRSLVVRTVAGGAALVVGVGLVAATAQTDLNDMQRAVGMGGALLGWLGVLLLAPLLASAVLNPLSRLVSRHGSALSRLAVRNAIRDPRRTAATASALMIGLALVAAFATVGSSFSNTLTGAIRADLPADVSVVRAAQPWSPLPGPIVDQLAGVSGVDALAGPVMTGGSVSAGSRPAAGLTVTGVEPAGLGRAVTPRMAAGSASVADSGVLLPEDFATRQRIHVGDAVTVAFEPDGSFAGRVTGIYASSEVLRGAVVDRARLPEAVGGYREAVFVIGGDPVATRHALDALFADRPDVVVLTRDEMIASYTDNVELALNIVYGLLGAAIVIAVFGVVNTMALSVLERTREIGVFRAVGARRRLVRRAIRRESIVIALYGGLLGVLVGVLLGGVMQHVLLSTPIFSLSVPWPFVAGALGAMVVVGVLAAWWPARRAARTDVLRAIAAV